MAIQVYYSVRFECRAHGSLGVFTARVFDILAGSPAEAIERAGQEARQLYETRFGGDWRYTDGGGIWFKPDGAEAEMVLPCQVEALRG